MKKINWLFISTILLLFSAATSILSANEQNTPSNGSDLFYNDIKTRRKPGPMNKMSRESVDDKFELVNIRISEKKNEILIVDLAFNHKLEPQSINGFSVLINEKPFNDKTVRFSKDGRKFRFFVRNPPEIFDIKIHGIKSDFGEIIPQTFVTNASENSIFHLKNPDEKKMGADNGKNSYCRR